MLKFFRRFRQQLLNENKFSKYILYAIGEIVLVVIGILIALQINNWNEERKDKALMRTNIQSIAEDIHADILDFKKVSNTLIRQGAAAKNIIPIMESKNKFITDSLKFILEFNSFTITTSIIERNTTWGHLNSSGHLSQFPDAKLLKLLQNYYNSLDRVTKGLAISVIPTRLEIRKLKYELFSDSEHRKFFPTDTPKAPNAEVYNAIFEDKRVLPLCRYIGSTANYFEGNITSINSDAENIISYIEQIYIALEP